MEFERFAGNLTKMCGAAYPGVARLAEFLGWANRMTNHESSERAVPFHDGTLHFALFAGASFGTVCWRHSQDLALGVSLVRVEGRWLLAVVYVCDRDSGNLLDWVETALETYFLRANETDSPERELREWVVAQCSAGRTSIH